MRTWLRLCRMLVAWGDLFAFSIAPQGWSMPAGKR